MIRGNVYYRLVGQDKEYKLLNDSPRVVYENLRAGEYQFLQKQSALMELKVNLWN